MCARSGILGRLMPGAMVARSWLLLLGLAAAAAGVRQVRGQPEPGITGFISLDCGLPEHSSYVDKVTKIPYTSDAAFTDAGSNHNMSVEYIKPRISKRYINLRSFPDAARSCYTLPSLVSASKYLLRAVFMYGNYDGLDKLPVFDLYLGVNFWQTVNISTYNSAKIHEVIAVVPSDSVQVCLVNIGSGTPFISGLDLRPMKKTLYPQVNATQGLVLIDRTDLGMSDDGILIRYPHDPYDRVWLPGWAEDQWSEISTTEKVQDVPNNVIFNAPSVVMQTAMTPRRNTSKTLELLWDTEPNHVYPISRCVSIFYIAELQLLPSNALRQFDFFVNGQQSKLPHTPKYLVADALYNREPHEGSNHYNFTLKATANSTLPPIVNAFEFFSVISTANVGTDYEDVSAINAIKGKYQVKKNWMGDPCVPKTMAWDGLICSYAISGPPRITNVNMSFSGLSGDISSYFANIRYIQDLDLSYNNLAGSIPNILSQLPSLVMIDLTGNQLNGSIPSGFLQRMQDGTLTLRYGKNPNICSNSSSCEQPTKKKSNSMLAVYIAVPIVAVVVIATLLVLLILTLRKRKASRGTVKPQNEASGLLPHTQTGNGYSPLQLDNHRFTYRQLEVITDNFRRQIGQGGFGPVFDGSLEDGTRVAVKRRDQSSNQGDREFLAEAQTITKIHHKNLVSLIGYCVEGEHLALVYEHMSEGNLEDKLRGRDRNSGSLTWRQRLCIALESAQGLEYLHKACSPPFVHRDVKPSNILLNANLEAKVADFGLMKAFSHNDDTHVSTERVAGTLGYLAPEYVTTCQLTEKSDVYSFGIVLLELVTGQPVIQRPPERTHIIQWARQRLARGNIEDVIDTRMQGGYDANGAWKVANVALKCTAQAAPQRPTMADVVARLQECLEQEGDPVHDGRERP